MTHILISDRQKCLDCIEFFTDKKPNESDKLNLYCSDALDIIQVVIDCEKELDIHIDCNWVNADDFDSVKDFIDWILKFK